MSQHSADVRSDTPCDAQWVDAHDGSAGASPRTAADTAALLLELERGLKAVHYYPDGSIERDDLLDRCHRAWDHDLGRYGPLRLEVRGTSFWFGAPATPVGPGRGEDLAREFAHHGLSALVFEPGLGAESLHALLRFLCLEPGDPTATRQRAEIAEQPGIRLAEAESARSEGDETPPPDPMPPSADDTAPSEVFDETIDPETTLTGLAPPPEAVPAPTPQESAAPHLEIDALLEELEDCDDDNAYRELGYELATLAARRVEDGAVDQGYAVLLCFARHASDDQKRSVEQRYVAERSVNRLCEGPLLGVLIDRAAAPEADTALRASEALLVLGSPAVGPLLRRVSGEPDRVTRGRLSGVVLAMGEEAATALLAELKSDDPARSKAALRLSGETQNPRLVPALRELLLRGASEPATDAAKALVQIGDVAAYEALIEALQCPRPEVVRLATYALGRTGRPLVIAPLVGVLERALELDALDLAREAVRSLGRLGHADAVPPLCRVMQRGGFFSRRRLRELKLAAIGSLRALPGDAAEGGLRAALGQRDRALRDAARSALLHRGSRPD